MRTAEQYLVGEGAAICVQIKQGTGTSKRPNTEWDDSATIVLGPVSLSCSDPCTLTFQQLDTDVYHTKIRQDPEQMEVDGQVQYKMSGR